MTTFQLFAAIAIGPLFLIGMMMGGTLVYTIRSFEREITDLKAAVQFHKGLHESLCRAIGEECGVDQETLTWTPPEKRNSMLYTKLMARLKK